MKELPGKETPETPTPQTDWAWVANPDGQQVLSDEQRARIAKRLSELGVALPCPRCGYDDFSVEDAIFKHSVHLPQRDSSLLPKIVIPTVATTCDRCGFLAEFAMGTLGFLTADGYTV